MPFTVSDYSYEGLLELFKPLINYPLTTVQLLAITPRMIHVKQSRPPSSNVFSLNGDYSLNGKGEMVQTVQLKEYKKLKSSMITNQNYEEQFKKLMTSDAYLYLTNPFCFIPMSKVFNALDDISKKFSDSMVEVFPAMIGHVIASYIISELEKEKVLETKYDPRNKTSEASSTESKESKRPSGI